MLSCLEFAIGCRKTEKRVPAARSEAEIQQKGRDFNVGLVAGSLSGRFISNNVCPRFFYGSPPWHDSGMAYVDLNPVRATTRKELRDLRIYIGATQARVGGISTVERLCPKHKGCSPQAGRGTGRRSPLGDDRIKLHRVGLPAYVTSSPYG